VRAFVISALFTAFYLWLKGQWSVIFGQ